jgi:hypothetical protein
MLNFWLEPRVIVAHADNDNAAAAAPQTKMILLK